MCQCQHQDGQEQADGYAKSHQRSPLPRSTLRADGGPSEPRIPRVLGPLPSVHHRADPSHLTCCAHPPRCHYRCRRCPTCSEDAGQVVLSHFQDEETDVQRCAGTLPLILPSEVGSLVSSVSSSVLSPQLETPPHWGGSRPELPLPQGSPCRAAASLQSLRILSLTQCTVSCFLSLLFLSPVLPQNPSSRCSRQDSGAFSLGHPDPDQRPPWD